ncbi:hypothetical protein [Desulfonatronum thioautotrophicum]|uniref:hypothetical protein n=1 Tax=Desulfonatronum thioautotrophicum TaxID=617001 RepID=UPI0005EAE6E4|nr:hypothetical protein [Desulfonatronum thioautotrophicum]
MNNITTRIAVDKTADGPRGSAFLPKSADPVNTVRPLTQGIFVLTIFFCKDGWITLFGMARNSFTGLGISSCCEI